MQINGAHLATVFSPKPTELQEPVRKPVTIDAEPSFKLENERSSQAKVDTQAVAAEIRVNDGQQARFVRFFSVSDDPSSKSSKAPLNSTPLPQGVEQYLQVASLQTEPNQSYLDEIV